MESSNELNVVSIIVYRSSLTNYKHIIDCQPSFTHNLTHEYIPCTVYIYIYIYMYEMMYAYTCTMFERMPLQYYSYWAFGITSLIVIPLSSEVITICILEGVWPVDVV